MIKNNMKKKKKNVINRVRVMTSSVSIIADDLAEGLHNGKSWIATLILNM